MALPDAVHKASCDAMVNTAGTGAGGLAWVAVFTGAGGGTTGTNEATGASYQRKQTTFPTGAMSGGYWVRTGSDVNVPVDPGTYTEAGLCSAATGGTFGGSAPFVGGDVEVSGAGAQITITPNVKA